MSANENVSSLTTAADAQHQTPTTVMNVIASTPTSNDSRVTPNNGCRSAATSESSSSVITPSGIAEDTLLVEISDALSEKDKVKFTVHTRTTLSGFAKSDNNVVRQHEEFVWLHDRFEENEDYGGYIVSLSFSQQNVLLIEIFCEPCRYRHVPLGLILMHLVKSYNVWVKVKAI